MSKKYPKEIATWANSLKVPSEELQSRYDMETKKLAENHPEWDEKAITVRALKIVFSFAKSLKNSRATPYDIMIIGLSGVRDMNNNKRKNLLEMYAKDETKEAALAGIEGARVKVLINQTTGDEKPIVVDDREMIEWDEPSGRHRTAKNRYYGKELPILPVRDIVAVGMKSFPDEGDENVMKVIRISAMNAPAESVPPMWEPVRTRLTIREDLGLYVNARTAAATTWNTPVDVSWVGPDIKTIEGQYDFLGGMPDIFQVEDLGESLKEWHAINEDDFSRFCIVEADIAYLSTEPNSAGSYQMAIENLEAFDLEAPAIQGFLPAEIYEMITPYAEGTHARFVVRTSMSNIWDREKGGVADPDPETGEIPQRIQLNYMGVAVDPDGIVAREDFEETDEIYEQ